MPNEVPCQLCSSTDATVIQSTHVYLNSLELFLVKCVECGLVYLNPQPVLDEIVQLYSKEYFLKWYSTDTKREFSKSFFRRLVSQSKLTSDTGHNLLDIGCGMGYFLEVAREWGYHAKGVEISPFAAGFCIEELNFDVHCGLLETANYPSEYFDIITAFDFLEHLTELSHFLPAVDRILKPEGLFIVLVPNYDSLVFQLDRNICRVKKAPLPNVPEHLTYFTLSTLKQLLKRHGFKIGKLITMGANDQGDYLRIRGNATAVLRATLNTCCYVLGKMANRREAILAVAKKPD